VQVGGDQPGRCISVTAAAGGGGEEGGGGSRQVEKKCFRALTIHDATDDQHEDDAKKVRGQHCQIGVRGGHEGAEESAAPSRQEKMPRGVFPKNFAFLDPKPKSDLEPISLSSFAQKNAHFHFQFYNATPLGVFRKMKMKTSSIFIFSSPLGSALGY
jgi:hypothetical protein